MTVKVLVSEKHKRFNQPVVTLSPKLQRLTLNRAAFSMLVKEYAGESQYAQILWDDEDNSGIFWIVLCEATAPGCRKLDVSSRSTRTCCITTLIESLGYTSSDTSHYHLTWDKQIKGGKVNTNEPL